MEKGDFGTCEVCRSKIGTPRLHAMPWARYCIVCQSKAEGLPR
jgi:RNA polymerase-binding transcription factor DksA